MKKRLEQLTMGQFIDLACGNMHVLAEGDEIIPIKDAALALRDIILEYRSIVDDGGTKSYIYRLERVLKAKMSIALYGICKNLVDMGEYDAVRETLVAVGVIKPSVTDERLEAEVTYRLERAKKEVSDFEDADIDERPSENIRRGFDEQTASLMTYFKFQIDTSTMAATVYAHLVNRHNREIKAMISAMKRR